LRIPTIPHTIPPSPVMNGMHSKIPITSAVIATGLLRRASPGGICGDP
jgi:hypothetical protein